jgi:hypothetical protein
MGEVVTGKDPSPVLYPTAVCETRVILPATSPTFRTRDPDFVESCLEVAMIVVTPAAAGVKTPEELIAPWSAGLTLHITVRS